MEARVNKTEGGQTFTPERCQENDLTIRFIKMAQKDSKMISLHGRQNIISRGLKFPSTSPLLSCSSPGRYINPESL